MKSVLNTYLKNLHAPKNLHHTGKKGEHNLPIFNAQSVASNSINSISFEVCGEWKIERKNLQSDITPAYFQQPNGFTINAFRKRIILRVDSFQSDFIPKGWRHCLPKILIQLHTKEYRIYFSSIFWFPCQSNVIYIYILIAYIKYLCVYSMA